MSLAYRVSGWPGNRGIGIVLTRDDQLVACGGTEVDFSQEIYQGTTLYLFGEPEDIKICGIVRVVIPEDGPVLMLDVPVDEVKV